MLIKRTLLALLLFFITGTAARIYAADYSVVIDLSLLEVNGTKLFTGDTTIKIRTGGTDVNARQTILKSGDWEFAMSFEIKPGGKDPTLKKYGVKGKTWKYIRHLWYKEKGGEWKELTASVSWQYIQREGGEVKCEDTVNLSGAKSSLKTVHLKYDMRITKV